MSSADSRSEQRLAEIGLEPLADRDHLRLLVAGLGIGYTVASALACPGVLEVEVVEVEPAVVEWARTVLAPLAGRPLEDPRVTVVVRDIADHLSTARGPYDVVLLDVDNGPGWLVHEGNARLYEQPSLERIRDLLSEGGVLATWSSERSEPFRSRLDRVFGGAEEIAIESGREPRGNPVCVYRARRAIDMGASPGEHHARGISRRGRT
jgi:spermidine synthase